MQKVLARTGATVGAVAVPFAMFGGTAQAVSAATPGAPATQPKVPSVNGARASAAAPGRRSGPLTANGGGRIVYTPGDAVNYAEAHWNNSNYPRFNGVGQSDDCTDFVSQAIWAGGYPMDTLGGDYSANSWWYGTYPSHSGIMYNYSAGWAVANDFKNLLLNRGWALGEGEWGPDKAASYYTPNAVVAGDPIFYDWYNDGTIHHASIQEGIGYSSVGDNKYGNLVDAHSNAGNRHKVFWSLAEFNNGQNGGQNDLDTTYYHFVHMTSD